MTAEQNAKCGGEHRHARCRDRRDKGGGDGDNQPGQCDGRYYRAMSRRREHGDPQHAAREPPSRNPAAHLRQFRGHRPPPVPAAGRKVSRRHGDEPFRSVAARQAAACQHQAAGYENRQGQDQYHYAPSSRGRRRGRAELAAGLWACLIAAKSVAAAPA